jgi:hypothetical protein
MPISKDDALDWWYADGVYFYNECALRRVDVKNRRRILEKAKARAFAAAPHCDTVDELRAIALTAFPK